MLQLWIKGIQIYVYEMPAKENVKLDNRVHVFIMTLL